MDLFIYFNEGIFPLVLLHLCRQYLLEAAHVQLHYLQQSNFTWANEVKGLAQGHVIGGNEEKACDVFSPVPCLPIHQHTFLVSNVHSVYLHLNLSGKWLF